MSAGDSEGKLRMTPREMAAAIRELIEAGRPHDGEHVWVDRGQFPICCDLCDASSAARNRLAFLMRNHAAEIAAMLEALGALVGDSPIDLPDRVRRPVKIREENGELRADLFAAMDALELSTHKQHIGHFFAECNCFTAREVLARLHDSD